MEQLPEIIRALSQELAVPAEQVFNMLVAREVVASRAYLWLSVVVFCCGGLGVLVCAVKLDDVDRAIAVVLFASMLITGLFAVVVNYVNMVAPEGAVLKELLL